MEKPLLNPEGVATKVDELYQLPLEQRRYQVSLIASDIRDWLHNNFAVTAEQTVFLDGLSPIYVEALEEQASRAVEHQWPITYVQHEAAKGLRGVKWIKSKGKDEAGEGPTKANEIFSGELTIETGY